MNGSSYFSVTRYEVTTRRTGRASVATAEVELSVGGTTTRCTATGNGPVHALDKALRGGLETDYPRIRDIRLVDYSVGIVGALQGTDARVRVLIQATDGEHTWDAGCVSTNVVDASFEALLSALVIGLMRADERARRTA